MFLFILLLANSAALNVALTDNTFPGADFNVVRGKLSVQWERIAPGSNVTHSVILQPLKSQFFNFTSAIVTYLPVEDGAEKVNSFEQRFFSLCFYC